MRISDWSSDVCSSDLMSQMTQDALKDAGLTKKEALRCKNLWALGLVYWMFGRRRQAMVDWLNGKFRDRPEIAAANIAALNAGHAFGETAELGADVAAYNVPPAEIAPGLYSHVTGAAALSWGRVAGAQGAGPRRGGAEEQGEGE